MYASQLSIHPHKHTHINRNAVNDRLMRLPIRGDPTIVYIYKITQQKWHLIYNMLEKLLMHRKHFIAIFVYVVSGQRMHIMRLLYDWNINSIFRSNVYALSRRMKNKIENYLLEIVECMSVWCVHGNIQRTIAAF